MIKVSKKSTFVRVSHLTCGHGGIQTRIIKFRIRWWIKLNFKSIIIWLFGCKCPWGWWQQHEAVWEGWLGPWEYRSHYIITSPETWEEHPLPRLPKVPIIPAGPSRLDDLFGWPEYHAKKLLVECDMAEIVRQNFTSLSQKPIHIYDAYSGMGTAAVMLHLQHKHMCSACLREIHTWGMQRGANRRPTDDWAFFLMSGVWPEECFKPLWLTNLFLQQLFSQ